MYVCVCVFKYGLFLIYFSPVPLLQNKKKNGHPLNSKVVGRIPPWSTPFVSVCVYVWWWKTNTYSEGTWTNHRHAQPTTNAQHLSNHSTHTTRQTLALNQVHVLLLFTYSACDYFRLIEYLLLPLLGGGLDWKAEKTKNSELTCHLSPPPEPNSDLVVWWWSIYMMLCHSHLSHLSPLCICGVIWSSWFIFYGPYCNVPLTPWHTCCDTHSPKSTKPTLTHTFAHSLTHSLTVVCHQLTCYR